VTTYQYHCWLVFISLSGCSNGLVNLGAGDAVQVTAYLSTCVFGSSVTRCYPRGEHQSSYSIGRRASRIVEVSHGRFCDVVEPEDPTHLFAAQKRKPDPPENLVRQALKLGLPGKGKRVI
jgi:hypothetical protein